MKYVLAPLAGFTDGPFRRLCFECGADLAYTEMVSAAGLAHGSSPTRHLMEVMPGEGPVACQLFGAKEDELALSARLCDELSRAGRPDGAGPHFVELNLNAGCPMTKVTCCGAGAKLVEDPEKVHRLLAAMTRETSLPVTLKTRLGPRPDRTRIFELLDAAERAGAKGIAVHARYTSQLHGGPVHLDLLAEVVARARIPVTGNGSVVDRATADAMAETGVAALMIGRAALANPGIFAALKATGRTDVLPTADEGVDWFRRHLEYVLSFRDRLAANFPDDHVPSPDGYASVKMHTHLFRYFNGRPGAAALRARLNRVRTLRELHEAVAAVQRSAVA